MVGNGERRLIAIWFKWRWQQ